jgi:hypothetical protein
MSRVLVAHKYVGEILAQIRGFDSRPVNKSLHNQFIWIRGRVDVL